MQFGEIRKQSEQFKAGYNACMRLVFAFENVSESAPHNNTADYRLGWREAYCDAERSVYEAAVGN